MPAVTNIQQGFFRTVTTNNTGEYQVKDLVLRVAEKARADATLALGQVST